MITLSKKQFHNAMFKKGNKYVQTLANISWNSEGQNWIN